MTHQPTRPRSAGNDAGRQVAQLAHVQELVGELAGRAGARDDALDRTARISAAYDAATPIVRQRFNVLAAETASWAAAGVEALVARQNPHCRAAAARLHDELDRAQRSLELVLGLG